MGIVEARIEREAELRLSQLLARMPDRGVLVVHTAFEPSALASRIVEQGLRASTGCRREGAWTLAIQPAGAREILDVRDLEAPEPLERILVALAALEAGDVLVARTPRVPKMLLPQLERRGLQWQTFEEPDGSGLVWMRKPAQA